MQRSVTQGCDAYELRDTGQIGELVPTNVWNIYLSYLHETGTYLSVSARNIPQNVLRRPLIFSHLGENEARAENPRVGGSIPPLATILTMLIFLKFSALGRSS